MSLDLLSVFEMDDNRKPAHAEYLRDFDVRYGSKAAYKRDENRLYQLP